MANKNSTVITFFRILHGLLGLYFILCIFYIYYAAFSSRFDLLLVISTISLIVEGFITFVINKGNCPFNFIQQKIGDEPFFNLFLAPKVAKRGVPFLATITIIGVILLLIRLFL